LERGANILVWEPGKSAYFIMGGEVIFFEVSFWAYVDVFFNALLFPSTRSNVSSNFVSDVSKLSFNFPSSF